jgi:hypothetical protein
MVGFTQGYYATLQRLSWDADLSNKANSGVRLFFPLMYALRKKSGVQA